MSVFTNHEKSDRVDRDGESRTHVEESRTLTRSGGAYPLDRIEEEVVDQRFLRSLDFSAATINGLLGIVLIALEAVLATRFLLIAFGANRASGFVSFMLDLSWPFVRPFSNAFTTHTWDQGVVEPASLLAMGVYAIIVALVMLVLHAVMPAYQERHGVARRQITHF